MEESVVWSDEDSDVGIQAEDDDSDDDSFDEDDFFGHSFMYVYLLYILHDFQTLHTKMYSSALIFCHFC